MSSLDSYNKLDKLFNNNNIALLYVSKCGLLVHKSTAYTHAAAASWLSQPIPQQYVVSPPRSPHLPHTRTKPFAGGPPRPRAVFY